METKLQAEKRDDTGKGVARKLRASGRVPGVLYGQGTEPVALLHGAGMGTDSHATWMLAVDAACVAVFGGAVALRLLTTAPPATKHLSPPHLRVAP